MGVHPGEVVKAMGASDGATAGEEGIEDPARGQGN